MLRTLKSPARFKVFVEISRVFLGCIFVVAGVSKLVDVYGFAEAVVKFDVMPIAFAAPFAILLPVVELALGTMLMAGYMADMATIVSAILMFAFTTVVGLNLWRGNLTPCRCFGFFDSSQISVGTLLRNVLLTLFAIFIVNANRRHSSKEIQQRPALRRFILAGVFLCGFVIVALNEVASGYTAIGAVKGYRDFHSIVAAYRPQKRILSGPGPLLPDGTRQFPRSLLDGKEVSPPVDARLLNAPLKLIIIFSVDDCALCLQESSFWEQLFTKYNRRQLSVIGIGTAATRNHLMAFGKVNEMSFPLYWDPGSQIGEDLKLAHSPARLLVNKRWEIVHASSASNVESQKKRFASIIDSCLSIHGETHD